MVYRNACNSARDKSNEFFTHENYPPIIIIIPHNYVAVLVLYIIIVSLSQHSQLINCTYMYMTRVRNLGLKIR